MNDVQTVFAFSEVVLQAGRTYFATEANPDYTDRHFGNLIEACDRLPLENGAAQIGLTLESGSIPRIVEVNIRVEVRDVAGG